MISFKKRAAGTTTGWIGIDFGMVSTKLVQVTMQAGQLFLQGSWCIKHSTPLAQSDLQGVQSALESHIATAPSLGRLFAGKRCAATLPMALSHVRLLDLPTASASEQANLVTEELLAELESDGGDWSVGYWPAAKAPSQDSGLARFAGYAVPRALADAIGKRLLKVGWSCQAIDAVPYALARAVQMLGYRRTEDAVLAVDLSHHQPLVVLVVKGSPVFVRVLRDVGIAKIIEPLCAEFQISMTECHQLLTRFGIPAPNQRVAVNTNQTSRVIYHPVQELLNEIQRTVEFIRQHLPAHKPTHACLFGGGASIRNLPQRISSLIQLPVITWSLRRDSERSRPEEAIYGLAAGLSALAMENQLCT